MIKRPKPVNYIEKEDLFKAVMDYQALAKAAIADGKVPPQQPNVFGKYILNLCERLSTRYNFNRYTFKDMMVSDAIEHCCKAITKFDPTKTDNIFNYFTTIAWRAFQLRILEERKQNAIKHKHYQHTHRISELAGGQHVTDYSNNEYSNRVIDEFEAKHINKPVVPKKKASKVTTLDSFLKVKKNDPKSKDNPSDPTVASGPSKRVARRKHDPAD